jgi:hypothetical protein
MLDDKKALDEKKALDDSLSKIIKPKIKDARIMNDNASPL